MNAQKALHETKVSVAYPIRVVQYGLGPIGSACAAVLLDKERTGLVSLVGAIDIDPEKIGHTVGDLLDRDCAVPISGNALTVLEEVKPDVVLHTTGSFLSDIEGQLAMCASAGAHIVSSSEELSFPYLNHSTVSERLDSVAKKHSVTIVGTGVNPGYAMDSLVLAATGVCTHVHSVSAKRIVDASRRREPLQRKIGAGLCCKEFEELKKTGRFGHIGLEESLMMVANALCWQVDSIEESLGPVIAKNEVMTPYVRVTPGRVAGIRQTARGYHQGRLIVDLELQMFVGATRPTDTIVVDSDPPMRLEVQGGIYGDTATIGALVNAIPLVIGARPGLTDVTELPIPRAFAS